MVCPMEKKFTIFLSTICLLVINGDGVDGMRCLSCTNITDASTCTGVSQCQYGEACFQHVVNVGDSVQVSMGCMNNKNCGTQHNDQTTQCKECCSSDNCNKFLCGQTKYGACVDDIKVDCAFMNTISNICENTEVAKKVCQNFCGLCNTDRVGKWAEWSNWSPCDTTCGNGTESRSRECRYPPVSNGPSVCNGSRSETRTCSTQACPDSLVCYSCDHGAASSLCWNGNTVHCPSGHACFNHFTTTGMGGTGSHGCTKISNCNDIRYGDYAWHVNNTDTIVGRDIARNKRGYSYCFQCCHYDKCNDQFCSSFLTPGDWGSWTSWSSCGVTCGSGTQSRHRACDNPSPSDPRLQCAGNHTETRSCQEKLCQEPVKCYTCTIGWSVDGCNTVSTCQTGEVCFVNFISAGMGMSYELGCTAEEHCKNGSFVNVRVPQGVIHRWDCCQSSLCNKHNLA